MRADGVERVLEVLDLDAFGAYRDRGSVQVPGRADDPFGRRQGRGRLGAEGPAVAADHRDLGTHAAASAILVWPVKSTMMTWIFGAVLSAGPASSAQNRLRTWPAPSHSSAACLAVFAAATRSARSWLPPAARVTSRSRVSDTFERV